MSNAVLFSVNYFIPLFFLSKIYSKKLKGDLDVTGSKKKKISEIRLKKIERYRFGI